MSFSFYALCNGPRLLKPDLQKMMPVIEAGAMHHGWDCKVSLVVLDKDLSMIGGVVPRTIS